MYKNDGVLMASEVPLPNEEILKKGKIAIIECVENIPCNPCETSCPQGAIKIGSNICNLPKIDYSKCTGCSLCLAVCPGLAIFAINKYASNDKSEITIPYELNETIKKGMTVKLINRSGEIIGNGEISNIREMKIQKNRKIVSILIDRSLIEEVRHFKP
jgi:Fe-S-cluster-containing hydrogenase component 2